MIKPIAIVAIKPNSISSEIIFKSWKLKKKYPHKPFIRVSPDHGVAENIMGKNIADPKSLIESIKFFNLIKEA